MTGGIEILRASKAKHIEEMDGFARAIGAFDHADERCRRAGHSIGSGRRLAELLDSMEEPPSHSIL